MTLAQQEPKKIYIRVEAQPITTAGIYHNSDLGLISLSSDGSTRITIADKNLGATSTDTSLIASYGYVYQWGNNYGFPSADTSVSFTNSTSSTAVNASTYGPGNYYSSSTWITAYPRESSANSNLRGGTTGTNEAMRGPCNSGYHIPSQDEITNINTALTSLGLDANAYKTYLKMPTANARNNTSPATINRTGSGMYWTSTFSSSGNSFRLRFSGTTYNLSAYTNSYGLSIRPFKNEARPPYEGESGWTKLY